MTGHEKGIIWQKWKRCDPLSLIAKEHNISRIRAWLIARIEHWKYKRHNK